MVAQLESQAPDIWCDGVLASLGWLYLCFAYAIVELRIAYFNLCPYALFTGSPCPLCGSTRIIGELLHGHLALPATLDTSMMWFMIVVCIASTSSAKLGRRVVMRYRPSIWSGPPLPTESSVSAIERR